MIKVVLAGLVGLLLGIMGSKILFVGSYLSLLPWGFVGLGLGYLSSSYKHGILSGVVYGFVLVLAFMISGYSGSAPIASVVVLFGILGLVGAACGLVLGLVGHVMKMRVRPLLVKN